jgi:hypothetical protein
MPWATIKMMDARQKGANQHDINTVAGFDTEIEKYVSLVAVHQWAGFGFVLRSPGWFRIFGTWSLAPRLPAAEGLHAIPG